MSPANDFVVILVTAPIEVGPQLARNLVERGLAAGVNVVPGGHSVYRWQGEVVERDEAILVVKTTSDAVRALTDLLSYLQPYEKVIALPISNGSPSLLTWIADSVNMPEDAGDSLRDLH